jgi:hypothetical protein
MKFVGGVVGLDGIERASEGGGVRNLTTRLSTFRRFFLFTFFFLKQTDPDNDSVRPSVILRTHQEKASVSLGRGGESKQSQGKPWHRK